MMPWGMSWTGLVMPSRRANIFVDTWSSLTPSLLVVESSKSIPGLHMTSSQDSSSSSGPSVVRLPTTASSMWSASTTSRGSALMCTSMQLRKSSGFRSKMPSTPLRCCGVSRSPASCCGMATNGGFMRLSKSWTVSPTFSTCCSRSSLLPQCAQGGLISPITGKPMVPLWHPSRRPRARRPMRAPAAGRSVLSPARRSSAAGRGCHGDSNSVHRPLASCSAVGIARGCLHYDMDLHN
mmetsp:Transcript_101586/g.264918  ORF Transcript_101586/g.264918 Transcript_101586/m.264918 type:complete len:237 (-) Transcript_101586:2-712(-)